MKYKMLLLIICITISCTPKLEDNKRLTLKGSINNINEISSNIEVVLSNSRPSVSSDLSVEFLSNNVIGDKILGQGNVHSDGNFEFISIAQDGGFYQLSFLANNRLLQTGTVNRDYLIDLEEEFNNIQLPKITEVVLNFQNTTNLTQDVRYFVSYDSSDCNLNYNGTIFVGNSGLLCRVQGGRFEFQNTSQSERLFVTYPSTLEISFTNNAGNQNLVYAINSPNQTIDVAF